MKKLCYSSIVLLILFEILRVYLIMPLPGSQEIDSVDLAWFLHSWRWVFRIVLLIGIVVPLIKSFRNFRKWVLFTLIIATGLICWLTSFVMSAEKMFLQPNHLVLASSLENKIPGDHLVVGTEINGEATAYPIQLIAYHHQVLDTIGGKPVMITYCSVCRSGRIFEPLVNGKYEAFRLVGMDHFNAMFEDQTTGSWWRQATGTAVAGELKGTSLSELNATQMSVDNWFRTYPNGRVMQPDPDFIDFYDASGSYDRGEISGGLTGTDKQSWQPKSWIIGIEIDYRSTAYDWNYLVQNRVINDTIAKQPIAIVLSTDGQSFAAFERPDMELFSLEGDTILAGVSRYSFSGIGSSGTNLRPLKAYQEFWHSWQSFHPGCNRYPN